MYHVTKCPECKARIHIHAKSYGLKVTGCKHIKNYKWKIPRKSRVAKPVTRKRQTNLYQQFRSRMGQ